MEVRKQYTLLLVSGDQHGRTELSGFLMNSGYLVDEVSDAEEALAQCVKKKYVLMLVDLFIPGELNGVALIERIRQMQFKSAIVAFSNQGGKRIMEDALQAGADGYLPRDVLLAEILPAIKSLLPGLPSAKPTPGPPAPFSPAPDPAPAAIDMPVLFAHMPQGEVQNLLSQARKKELLPGQILAYDCNREIAMMLEGEAELLFKNRCVGALRKNETIGEASIFLHHLHDFSFTLVAQSWCLVLLLDKMIVKKYLKEHDRGLMLRFMVNMIASMSFRLLQTLEECSRLKDDHEAQQPRKDTINRISEIVNN